MERFLELRYLFLLLAINAFPYLLGQDKYDYHTDTLTYSQYLKADWESLYDSVRVAEKNDVDFYYLQLRGGFAAFYTQRYAKAEAFFSKAEEVQTASDIVNEYHYLSALYAGQRMVTMDRYETLSEVTKEKYKDPKRKIVEMINLESGVNYNADFKELNESSIDEGYGVYGERILLKNIIYNGLKVKHGFSPWLTVNQGFQVLYLNKEQEFYALEYGASSPIEQAYPISTTQMQYHINGIINIKDKLFVSPTYSYLRFKSQFIGIEYTDAGKYLFSNELISGNQQLFALDLSYRLQNLEFSAHSNYFWGEHFDRWQMGMEGQLFLKRNRSQYVSASFDMVNNKDRDWAKVWSLHYGFKVNKLWFELNHTTGDMRNYIESNGEIIYNTYEKIESKTGANMSIPLVSDQLWLSFYYRYINYASFSIYVDDALVLNKQDFTHNNHSITGGLTWYF